MRLSLIVNLLLVVAVATTVIGIGLFTNLLSVPGGAATPTPPPNTGPLPTFSPTPSPVLAESPSIAPTERPSLGGTYTVEPGDNLTLIANKYGISVDALIAANPQLLPPNYIIHAGDLLQIPDPAAQCDGWEAYSVQSGDFLVSIGEQFGVSPTDIADFNGLPFEGRHDYSDIRPGDVLCIPGPGWTPLRTPVPTP
ncbi:MAG TPA: LysM peptidoglycan-binding domain-containing protein [Candidatus Limnocylindria bacterium]|nr:LysM peptidoglycan-binding domain-containing protein [Candidatus Limnocylindria bacterium]